MNLKSLQNVFIFRIVETAYVLLSVFFALMLFPKEPNWISITIWIWAILMIAGQFAVFLPFSWAHHVYWVSFILSLAFVNFIWLLQRFPSLFQITYPISTLVFVILILFIHNKTKETISSRVELVAFSVFFFGLIIALSNWAAVPQLTSDFLYFGGLLFFAVISIFNLNTTYRINLLNAELHVRDRISMFRDYKKKLQKKDKPLDVDLILYYFKASIDKFVQGDFEASFMDAYKIVFDKAFDKLHKIQDVKVRRKSFKEVRNALAHAKVVGDVKELIEMKKQLCSKDIEILKIVKFEFMDVLSTKRVRQLRRFG